MDNSTGREFTPEVYPPFPEGLNTIELETLSLAKLETGDQDESDRLFEICKERGFFYLDFAGTSAASLPSEIDSLVQLGEDVFKLPREEKMKCKPNGTTNLIHGYKGAGIGLVDKKGTKSTNEFFSLSKNDMLSPNPTLYWPELILNNKPRLASCIETVHATGLSVLAALTTPLGLPADAFSRIHRISEQSTDNFRWIRGPPRQTLTEQEIQTASHRDFGTITILFNWLGGLQIWSQPEKDDPTRRDNLVDPADGEWQWVKPAPPGHAIINLGDCAVTLTNGLLCSGRHRVVPSPGAQGAFPRYTVVYFVRPEDKAILKSFESDVIPKYEGVEEEVETFEWIRRQLSVILGKKTFGLAPPGFVAKEAAKAMPV